MSNNAKLKNCSSCGATIAKSAASCPKCGAANMDPKGLLIVLAIFGVLIAILLVLPKRKTADEVFKETYNENIRKFEMQDGGRDSGLMIR